MCESDAPVTVLNHGCPTRSLTDNRHGAICQGHATPQLPVSQVLQTMEQIGEKVQKFAGHGGYRKGAQLLDRKRRLPSGVYNVRFAACSSPGNDCHPSHCRLTRRSLCELLRATWRVPNTVIFRLQGFLSNSSTWPYHKFYWIKPSLHNAIDSCILQPVTSTCFGLAWPSSGLQKL